MASLIAACAFFVGIHIVISGSPLRGVIVARVGERPYQGFFSLLSLVGMVWLVLAFRNAEGVWLWSPPLALRWAAPVVALIAFVFIVLGLTTPSPTAVEAKRNLKQPNRRRASCASRAIPSCGAWHCGRCCTWR